MTTVYPSQIDNSKSLPIAVDNFTPISAAFFNGLRNAIVAIEQSLGTNPAGIYGTVGSALQNLESTVGNLQIISLAQDIGGTLGSPIVVGLQGRPISSVQPLLNQVLSWNGIAWVPTDIVGGDIIFGRDLSGNAVAQTVIGIQGNPVSNATPATGQPLIWNGTQWIPGNNFGNQSLFTTGQMVSGPALSTSTTTGLLTVDGKIIANAISTSIPSNPGQGIIYFDSTQNEFLVSQNGSAYYPLVLNYTAQTFQTTGQINSGPLLATSVTTGLFTLNGKFIANSIENVSVSDPGQGIIYFDGYANKFLMSQNGGVYTPVQPYFNVQDYGATGNGVTDDTSAIQNTINAAAHANSQVFFPTGTYLISNTLNCDLTNSLRLTGLGTRGGGVVLKMTATGAGNLISAQNSNNFGISNMMINSTSTSFSGVMLNLTGSGGCHFQEVDFSGHNTASTHVLLTNTYDIVFDNCAFNGCGIGIYGVPDELHFSNQVTIRNCGNGEGTITTAVIQNPGAAWVIDNCVFEPLVNGSPCAILCGAPEADALTVRGCWLGDCTQPGTWLTLNAASADISGNTFQTAASGITVYAIQAAGPLSLNCTGNSFFTSNALHLVSPEMININFYGNTFANGTTLWDGYAPRSGLMQANGDTPPAYFLGCGVQFFHLYKFRAIQQTNQFIDNSVGGHACYYDSVDYNPNNMSWDGYHYVAPVNGYYMVMGSMGINAITNGYVQTWIAKNDSFILGGSGSISGAASGEGNNVALSTVNNVVYLNAGDKVSIYVIQTSSGILETGNAGNVASSFAVHYLSS